MNGAPAKPMSGVSPSSATISRTASGIGSTPLGVQRGQGRDVGGRAHRRATTGPVPATMSTPTPAARSGTTMSEKKIAASTP